MFCCIFKPKNKLTNKKIKGFTKEVISKSTLHSENTTPNSVDNENTFEKQIQYL